MALIKSLVSVAVIGIMAYFVVAVLNDKDVVKAFKEENKGNMSRLKRLLSDDLPECDSSDVKKQITDGFYEGPSGRLQGRSIVLFDEIYNDYQSKSEVRCSAKVELSDTSVHHISYKLFYIKGEQFTQTNFVD